MAKTTTPFYPTPTGAAIPKATPFYPTPTGAPISNVPANFNPVTGQPNTPTGGSSGGSSNPNGLTNAQVQAGYSTIQGNFNPLTGQAWNTTNNPMPPSNIIPALDQSPNNPINQKLTLPVKAYGSVNADGTVNKFDPNTGLSIAPVPVTTIDQQYAESDARNQKNQNDYLAGLLSDFQNKPTGASIDAQLQQQLGIKQKQEAVNNYTTQLNTIVAQGEANKLSVVGQGRGIPEAIIGGQQAQMARETAIQALPVQAQLSAAQGNLEMANQSLDRLFKIYSDDATNEFNYKTAVRKSVYDFATAQEKTKIDRIQLADTRAYDEQQKLNDERSAYAKMAYANNQSSLGSQIASLDYKSSTFKTDLAKLSSQIVDPNAALDTAIKQQQLIKAKADNNGTSAKLTKVTINGVDYMQDEKGNLSTPKIPAGTNESLPLLLEQGANDIKTIADLQLDNTSINASAGAYTHDKPFGQPFSMKIQDWQAQVGNTLAKLTLAELARVKGQGVTFGALSEGERKAVADSASVLNQGKIMKGTGENAVWTGNFSLSESEVKRQLGIIQSYAELDFKKRTGMTYQDYLTGVTGIYTNNVVDALETTTNAYNYDNMN